MNDIHVVLNATAAVFETCAKVLGSLSLRYLSIGFLFQQNMSFHQQLRQGIPIYFAKLN